MKKIAISMPVHEAPDCIENQLHNIFKYVPNSIVVLHVSLDSSTLLRKIESFLPQFGGSVFINPTRYHTFKHDEAAQVTNLSTVHASNIRYITSVVADIDVMAFETSNDMFVRHGIEDMFNNYTCGCSAVIMEPDDFPFIDTVLYLRKVIDPKIACKAPQEGLWVPIEAAKFFAEKIEELEKVLGMYIPGEEGFLANLCLNYDTSMLNNNSGHYVYHNSAEGGAVDLNKITEVRNGQIPFKYAVKRVPRNINDSIRKLINDLD